jgi:hypothetical protein
LRNHLTIAEPSGSLSVEGKYQFSYIGGAAAFAAQDVHAKVAALSVTRQGEQQPMLVADRIEATGARYDLAKRELILPRVELANGKFVGVVLADGTLNWRGAFRERPGTVSSPRQGGASSVFRTRVEAVSLDSVELHFTDHTRTSAAGIYCRHEACGFQA